MYNKKLKIVLFIVFVMFLVASSVDILIDVSAHDGHGHAPKSAKLLKSPLKQTVENIDAGKILYEQNCAGCHGLDGKANTDVAVRMKVKPTDLTLPYMNNLTQGEIYWVITKGILKSKMPSYRTLMSSKERWQTTLYVKSLVGVNPKIISENLPSKSYKGDKEDFVIKFKAKVRDRDFHCGESYDNIGITNSRITPTDFSLYISSIHLITEQGARVPLELEQDGKWQLDDLALLDFENGVGACSNGTSEIRDFIKGKAPKGAYTGISFTVGVPFDKNHKNIETMASPLNLSRMFWVWNAGHKFIRIDMITNGLPNGYFIHIGSTNCTPDETDNTIPTECRHPNRPEISLNGFNPQTDVVVLDLATLLNGANVDINQEGTARGCMCDQEDKDCIPIFDNLGLTFADKKSKGQKFFKVEKSSNKKTATSHHFNLPNGFPLPLIPQDNPITDAKVELGRYLFYDKRLSINRQSSCATCHKQDKAFTDGKDVSVGTTGEFHPRNSMSLANVVYAPTLTWANPLLHSLETQLLIPMFGEDPVELGLLGKEEELIARLKADIDYKQMFSVAFSNEEEPINIGNITKAISCFVRTLISCNSPYDNYRFRGEVDAISDSAKRGEKLFFSEKLECFHCHGGFNFSGATIYFGKELIEKEFHNTGLYNTDNNGSYPKGNRGVFEFTANTKDMGSFKAPTLRNIAVTSPYMHDGSIKTLDEVIDHYASGGRIIKNGIYAGNGSSNPFKSGFVKGFSLTASEREDLLNFLQSLTDEQFLQDPRFSNPWKEER